MRFRERLRQLCLLQSCVFDSSLRHEGDARVWIFPQRKKVRVLVLCLRGQRNGFDALTSSVRLILNFGSAAPEAMVQNGSH